MKKVRDWLVSLLIGVIRSVATWYNETIKKNEEEYINSIKDASKYVFDVAIHELMRDACKNGDRLSAIEYANKIVEMANTFILTGTDPFDLEANTSFFNHLKFFERLTLSIKNGSTPCELDVLLEEYDYLLQNFSQMVLHQSELKLRIKNTDNCIRFWAIVYNPTMT